MSLRRFVTLRWLKKNLACDQAVDAFVEDWGSDGKPTVHEAIKTCWKRGQWNWAHWLFLYALPTRLYWEWKMWPMGRRAGVRFARDYQRRADAEAKRRERGKRKGK
ncbi:MAG TPA: hypothetical protein VNA25_08140 [Phycisphaerae bacterium]|nr:hypothetical protein [Phycisphaerae bacterium]